MAKPSATNIRPPATPPQTSWDLNTLDPTTSDFYALQSTESGQFDTLTGHINLAGSGLDASALDDYGYVFFGVNGGYDETVVGNNSLSGIMVTGNGKDNITGGQFDDIVFSGNGADTVRGGGGDDILYGENGPDTLYGDAGINQLVGGNDQIFGGNGPDTIAGGGDTGEFSFSAGGLTVKDGVTVFETDPTGTTAPGTGNYNNQNGNPSEHLQHEGVFVNGSDVYEVFSFQPADVPPQGGTDQVTIALYDAGFNYTGQFFQITVTEGVKNFFTVELGATGGQIAVLPGWGLSLSDLETPNTDPDKKIDSTAFGAANDFVTVGDSEFHLQIGDILTGGNPDPNLLPSGSITTSNTYDPNHIQGVGDGSADTFVYNIDSNGIFDGVDLITDFHVEEGDTLVINGLPAGDTAKAIVHADPVNGNDTVFVVFQDASNAYIANAAIELAGISNPDLVTSHIVVNGTPLSA